jgi:predicted HTH transcriptional regulator
MYKDKIMKVITSEDFNTEKFKYSESNWLEFKQSINSCPIEKIIQTICAFLNTDGGYIIIGINDEEKIVGIKSKTKEIDKFKLSIDNKISTNAIVYQDDKIISEKYISITDITNNKKQKFLLIKITPQEGKNYKLMDGTVVHRLNASNRKIKSTKLMTESSFLSSIEQNQQNIINKYNKIIQELNYSIKEFTAKEENYKHKIKSLTQTVDLSAGELSRILKKLYPSPRQFTMK